MSVEENKELIRRYVQAVDDNHTSDWSILDEYIAEDFVAHNPLVPGVSLDREGMKQGSEIFRVATPGRHEITLQVAEGDLVVSHMVGRGVHEGELLGIPATNREVETEGHQVLEQVRRPNGCDQDLSSSAHILGSPGAGAPRARGGHPPANHATGGQRGEPAGRRDLDHGRRRRS